jgi:hypothetical protein
MASRCVVAKPARTKRSISNEKPRAIMVDRDNQRCALVVG